MSRQLRQLLILALILVGALASAYYWYPRQETVSGDIESLRLQPGEGSPNQKQVGLAGLKLDFGPKKPERFKAPKRDIFGPLYVVRKVKKKPVVKPKPKVKPKPIEIPKIVITPKVVNIKPLATFTLLGYLDKDGDRTVFLGHGEEIFLLKVGDTFAREYHVAEITSDLVLIKRETDDREIRIALKKANK